MAVAFRALGTGAFVSGFNSPIGFPGYPTGSVTGDVVFWAVAVTSLAGGVPQTFSAPSGWSTDADVLVDSGGSNPHRLLVYRKNFYTTGDASPGNLGLNNTPNDTIYTQTVSYSGATGIASVNTASGLTGGATVTTPGRGAGLEVAVFSQAQNSSGTPGTNFTERFDTAGSPNPTLIINDGPPSGNSTTETFSQTTRPWAAVAVHIIDTTLGVLVGATLSGVTFPLRHAGLGPFISSGGNTYFFGRDSVNTGQVEPHKATDPMSAFTAQTLKTMSSATTTAIEAMATYQVGQVIHVATQIATGVVYYNSYTMDTDTWSLTTSETPQAAAATTFAPVAGNTWVTLGVRSNGNVVFFYSGGVTVMSGTLNSVYYRERTGVNTYGTATAVATGTNNYTGGPIVMGASDRVHFHYKDHTNSDAYHRTLSAANALSVASAFDATADATLFVWGAGVSYVSGAATKVRAPYGDSGQTTSIVQYDSADTPTITTSTAVSGATVKATNTQLAHILANDSTTIHMLYSDATASDLQHDSNVNDGGWAADINEMVGTINAITPGVYTRSGRKLAMVLDDAGTIRYAEIDLSAAIHRRLISRAALVRSNRY